MHGIFLADVMVELKSELIDVLNISVNLRCFGSATTTTFFFPVCTFFWFSSFLFINTSNFGNRWRCICDLLLLVIEEGVVLWTGWY